MPLNYNLPHIHEPNHQPNAGQSPPGVQLAPPSPPPVSPSPPLLPLGPRLAPPGPFLAPQQLYPVPPVPIHPIHHHPGAFPYPAGWPPGPPMGYQNLWAAGYHFYGPPPPLAVPHVPAHYGIPPAYPIPPPPGAHVPNGILAAPNNHPERNPHPQPINNALT
ncbi:hypothetical protein V565_317980, partial [Rhizoctonia solani 123E]